MEKTLKWYTASEQLFVDLLQLRVLEIEMSNNYTATDALVEVAGTMAIVLRYEVRSIELLVKLKELKEKLASFELLLLQPGTRYDEITNRLTVTDEYFDWVGKNESPRWTEFREGGVPDIGSLRAIMGDGGFGNVSFDWLENYFA